jgi:hypothetical protein
MALSTYAMQSAIHTIAAGWTGAAAPVLPQRITGSGATESANAVALTPGRYYRLVNISASVIARYAGAQASGLSNVVIATTHPTLPVGQAITFLATAQTQFIYVESASGTYDVCVYEVDVTGP